MGLRMLRTKSPTTRLLANAWPGQVTMRWRLHLLGLLLSSSHTHSSLSSKPQRLLHGIQDDVAECISAPILPASHSFTYEGLYLSMHK